jgi:hypothetical protein
MKILGISFIVFGLFWTIAGFLTYASDIQLGIAVGGINMVGIGVVMVKLSDMTFEKNEV